jgi:hypothetical protein
MDGDDDYGDEVSLFDDLSMSRYGGPSRSACFLDNFEKVICHLVVLSQAVE